MNSGVQLRGQFILAPFHCPSLPPRTPSADQQFSILYLKQPQLFGAVDEYASLLIQITSCNLVLPSFDGLTTDSVMESGVLALYILLIMVCAYHCRCGACSGGTCKIFWQKRYLLISSSHCRSRLLALFSLKRHWAVITYSSLNTDHMDGPSDIALSCWKKTQLNETLQG